MKKTLVTLALFIGLVGVSHAGRSGGGWRPFTINSSSAQVFVGGGFLNSAWLGTGCSTGDFVVIADSVGNTPGVTGSSYQSFVSSNLVTTPLVFYTTSPVAGNPAGSGSAFNQTWAPGQAEDDYIEITNGLYIIKNNLSGLVGPCDAITVYYSK